MAKEKELVTVEEKKAPKRKKIISEKKADKNEIRTLVNSQKAEMKEKNKEITVLRVSLKGKSKEEQREIKKAISLVVKEKIALEKSQSIELKKKKKELKHKYKIASKAKKAELKDLNKKYKADVLVQKNKIKSLEITLKGKSKTEQKEIKKNISIEKKQLKTLEKEYKKAVKTIKKDLKTLKEKMKKPKGRVRLLPLILIVVIVGGGFVFVTFFLDGFLKRVIINTVESSYGAKCDIENVDFAIIDSYFLVEEFTLADRNSPMKNLFEFSRMIVDFDLTQLLLARFVADEVSVQEVFLGTARTVSGELPKEKQEAIAKKKKEKAEKEANSEFYQAMNDVTGNLGENSTNFIQDTIAKFTLDNILESYLSQLKTPGLVDGAQNSVEEVVGYWQKTIPTLEKDSTDFTKEIEDLIEIYSSPDVNPQVIKEGIEKTSNVLKESQKLYDQLEEVYANVEKDSEKMKTLSSDIKNAVIADKNFVTTEIDNIISFDSSDAEGLIASMVEDYIVAALGEYYPMVAEGLAYVNDVKARFNNVSKKEEKKTGFERLKGQTIVFNKQMPSFLVKEMNFSGADAEGWMTLNGYINDITHQPELIGKPITMNMDLSISQYDVEVDGIVDIRDDTANKLVELDFVGDGLDTDFLMNPTTVGVPSVDGKMGLDGELNIGKEGDFFLASKVRFNPVVLNTMQFEPPEVYGIYKNVLATINDFYLDAEVGFSLTDGITIDLDTDADKKIFAGLEFSLNKVVDDVKISVQNDIKEYLDDYTKQFESELLQFDSVKNDFTNVKDKLGNAQEELKKKQNQYQEELKSQAEDKIKDTAKDALGNLFGGF